MAYSSRVKDALDDIVTELETITAANGYYTAPTIVRAIRPAEAVVNTPEIGVEMGEEEMKPIDDNATVFDSDVNVYVVGTTSANTALDSDSSELVDATEKLRHDIKRVIAGMFYKYAPTTNSRLRWNVMKGTLIIIPVMRLGDKRNKAQIWARFKIKVRRQGSATLAAGHGEEGFGEAGAGFYGF